MVCGLRLRSPPRVYGTTQYEHILLHPLIIEIKALTPFSSILTGEMSAYVSSSESLVFICFSLSVTAATRRGRSLYASGPATISTQLLSNSFSFSLSAMHPSTPTITLLRFFSCIKASSLPQIRCSALSLMEQVFTKITSALEISFVSE